MRSRPLRTGAATATVLALTLVTAACGGDSGTIAGLEVTGAFGEEPTVSVDGLDVSEAESQTLTVGEGDEIAEDSTVLYRFVIADGTDGTVVATNYDQDSPQRMDVATEAEVIKSVVSGATVGSRLALALPVTELLGESGAPQAGLEPDEDVVMVFDLIELGTPPLKGPEGAEVDPPATAPKVVTGEGTDVASLDFSDAPADPPGDLQVIPLVEGEGDPIQVGDSITVDYYASVWPRGDDPFDNTYPASPATFQFVEGGLIDGWTQGLEGVTAGSRVMLIIPPRLGYGASGQGEDIPGGSTLVFVIDVLGIGL